MSQQLIQVLQFGPVAPGATQILPHNININGRGQVPDYIAADQAGVRINATRTQIELTNNTGENIAQCNVWLELKHSIPREIGKAFGSPFASLDTRPFIPASSSDRFPFMEANVSADAATILQTYNVQSVVHVPASGLYTINLVTPCPAPLGSDRAVVTLGLQSGVTPGMITSEWASASQLLVRTFSAAGAAADLAFGVNVSLTIRNN